MLLQFLFLKEFYEQTSASISFSTTSFFEFMDNINFR
jgi:hypothetical protein